MKGNGNSFSAIAEKVLFFMLPTAGLRNRYIRRNAKKFRHIGGKLLWQPRQFPTDPERISIGNNVLLSSNVVFITHDTSAALLNYKYGTNEFAPLCGCIEIGDNVMIGTGVRILPNVRIGSNVVIGAGAVVTKDIPDNSVAAGVPCKVIGTFESWVEKRRANKKLSGDEHWDAFYEQRKSKID